MSKIGSSSACVTKKLLSLKIFPVGSVSYSSMRIPVATIVLISLVSVVYSQDVTISAKAYLDPNCTNFFAQLTENFGPSCQNNNSFFPGSVSYSCSPNNNFTALNCSDTACTNCQLLQVINISSICKYVNPLATTSLCGTLSPPTGKYLQRQQFLGDTCTGTAFLTYYFALNTCAGGCIQNNGSIGECSLITGYTQETNTSGPLATSYDCSDQGIQYTACPGQTCTTNCTNGTVPTSCVTVIGQNGSPTLSTQYTCYNSAATSSSTSSSSQTSSSSTSTASTSTGSSSQASSSTQSVNSHTSGSHLAIAWIISPSLLLSSIFAFIAITFS